MCMGVATANSILVVAFARERLDHHADALKPRLKRATRFRPVLMTALAMIIGMVPMALATATPENKTRRWDAPSSADCCRRR